MRAASVTNAALGVALGVRELDPELPALRRRLAAQDGAPFNRPLEDEDVVEIDDLGDNGAVRSLARDLPPPLRRIADWTMAFHSRHAGRTIRLTGALTGFRAVGVVDLEYEIAEACGVDVPTETPFYSNLPEPNYRLAMVTEGVSVAQLTDALVFYAAFCRHNHIVNAAWRVGRDESEEVLAALQLEPLLDGAVATSNRELAASLHDFATSAGAARAAAVWLFQRRTGGARRNSTVHSADLLPELRPAPRLFLRIDAQAEVECGSGTATFECD